MKILGNAALILLVGVTASISNSAIASVFFDVSGQVIQRDATAKFQIGDPLSGYVELTDAAANYQFPQEFALGNGDVLSIFIMYGTYEWTPNRPSVDWVQFEGFMNAEKTGFLNISVRLLENFSGIISAQYCPVNQVCDLSGGINNVALYDGFGTSVASTVWSRRVPEPTTLALLALAGLGFARRRKLR